MAEDTVPNDKPLLPSDEDWEERVAELLRGDKVDADLGRRMARDAIRVAQGELSDEEFNERYRDEVRRVFATEEWPPDAATEGPDTDSSVNNSDNSDQSENDPA